MKKHIPSPNSTPTQMPSKRLYKQFTRRKRPKYVKLSPSLFKLSPTKFNDFIRKNSRRKYIQQLIQEKLFKTSYYLSHFAPEETSKNLLPFITKQKLYTIFETAHHLFSLQQEM